MRYKGLDGYVSKEPIPLKRLNWETPPKKLISGDPFGLGRVEEVYEYSNDTGWGTKNYMKPYIRLTEDKGFIEFQQIGETMKDVWLHIRGWAIRQDILHCYVIKAFQERAGSDDMLVVEDVEPFDYGKSYGTLRDCSPGGGYDYIVLTGRFIATDRQSAINQAKSKLHELGYFWE